MVQKLKKRIQDKLNSICYKKYEQEVERQKDVYRQWYLKKETWRGKKPLPADPELVVFADRDGVVEEAAAGLAAAFFQAHPWVQIAYGDEDCLDETGRRYAPWFKPQWSPDTLESFQYFGHFFVVRRKLLQTLPQAQWEACLQDCSSPACYRLLLELTGRVTAGDGWIFANDREKAIMPIGEVLIHMKKEKEDVDRAALEAWEQQETETAQAHIAKKERCISVIIPSKDNPKVLETCISSIREKTLLRGSDGTELRIELLVVDNGSSEENRRAVSALADKYNMRYLYEPMPFNFSRMCNLGAEQAQGAYLLLLNDDMEILQPDWLLKLYEKASLPHAGGVGAKLLYPDSDVIQHIGITNILVGPVHKLLKQHDKNSYYHGQNRHIYDMIGVTAACLLVSAEKFRQAGRLYEEMAVAYNDVDFCFALYELGYYNILRNDVVLYHHESLSRGDDTLSDEKWIRLLQEKDILYGRHPSLKGFDPFYSRNLAVHSNLYLPAFRYDYEKRDYYTKVKAFGSKAPTQWENGCLILNVEHAREERKLEFTERDDVYWIEGWSYVLGMDNCRYKRSLLLLGEAGSCYEAAVLDRYRKDVADILPNQQNVALAGFVCRIPQGVLPPDRYTIAMLSKDRCSGQRLYQQSEKVLCTKAPKKLS